MSTTQASRRCVGRSNVSPNLPSTFWLTAERFPSSHNLRTASTKGMDRFLDRRRFDRRQSPARSPHGGDGPDISRLWFLLVTKVIALRRTQDAVRRLGPCPIHRRSVSISSASCEENMTRSLRLEDGTFKRSRLGGSSGPGRPDWKFSGSARPNREPGTQGPRRAPLEKT